MVQCLWISEIIIFFLNCKTNKKLHRLQFDLPFSECSNTKDEYGSMIIPSVILVLMCSANLILLQILKITEIIQSVPKVLCCFHETMNIGYIGLIPSTFTDLYKNENPLI